MPIGSFIVTTTRDRFAQVKEMLQQMAGITLYGEEPKQGYLVVVMESETSKEMEEMERRVKKIEGVTGAFLAYLYYEDELEKIEKGELRPEISFEKKRRT